MLVLDTDVLSALERDRVPHEIGRHMGGRLLAITFVTLGEAHLWHEMRSWAPRRRSGLLARLADLFLVPYDADIAQTWARLTAAARRRGRPMPANDTWIAACCIVGEVPLLTMNLRHFDDFAEHDGLVLLR